MDSRIGYLSGAPVYDSSNFKLSSENLPHNDGSKGNHGIANVIIVLLAILVMVGVVALVVVGKELGIGHLAWSMSHGLSCSLAMNTFTDLATEV